MNVNKEFILSMKSVKSRKWSSFFNTNYIERISSLAIHLLDSLLVMDHNSRISPRQAMDHSYF
ncbi:MAG: hypothetical protein MHPSP_001854, partial [Paramarteilia canceri]